MSKEEVYSDHISIMVFKESESIPSEILDNILLRYCDNSHYNLFFKEKSNGTKEMFHCESSRPTVKNVKVEIAGNGELFRKSYGEFTKYLEDIGNKERLTHFGTPEGFKIMRDEDIGGEDPCLVLRRLEE